MAKLIIAWPPVAPFGAADPFVRKLSDHLPAVPLSDGLKLTPLVLHGLLHLGGYDHEADSGQMARKEAVLRRRFGLAAGLIERTKTPPARKRATMRRRGSL